MNGTRVATTSLDTAERPAPADGAAVTTDLAAVGLQTAGGTASTAHGAGVHGAGTHGAVAVVDRPVAVAGAGGAGLNGARADGTGMDGTRADGVGLGGADLAEIHDLLDAARGEHFAAAAALVTRLIRDRRPAARALLDVGCGTAAHLAHFARTFAHVQGVEPAAAMLAVARRNMPAAQVHHGDLAAFALPYRFDAVVCLSAAIARQRTAAGLTAALRRFARHLWPGGVLVVDPWWFPETFLPGQVAAEVLTPGGQSIARVSHARRVGDESWTEAHYVVADDLRGIRHHTETHRHTLFTRDGYDAALREAGFSAEYLPGVQSGRGLFVGVWEGGGAA